VYQHSLFYSFLFISLIGFLAFIIFRSYAEGEYGTTPVSSHGHPRRTLVLILSELALDLYHRGLYSVADICLSLAKDSENSCTEKAQARDKPSITPAFIKVQLKLAEAESAWTPNAAITDEDGNPNLFHRIS
jgi:hypothetical protein